MGICLPTVFKASRVSRDVLAVAVWTAAHLATPSLVAQETPTTSPNSAAQDDKDAAKRAKSFRIMRTIAQRFSVKYVPDTTTKMRPEPVFRYTDTARGWNDGTIWAWDQKGRPAMLLTLAIEDGHIERGYIAAETTALADASIECRDDRGFRWLPAAPGVRMKRVPDAGIPATSKRRRTIQLRQIAKRFTAYEYWYVENRAKGKQRFQLRLLPQPVYRYADKEAAIIEGAVFLFNYGSNPEVVMLIEAHGNEDGKRSWLAGFARTAGADLFVHLGDQEFWEARDAASRKAYRVFDAPISKAR